MRRLTNSAVVAVVLSHTVWGIPSSDHQAFNALRRDITLSTKTYRPAQSSWTATNPMNVPRTAVPQVHDGWQKRERAHVEDHNGKAKPSGDPLLGVLKVAAKQDTHTTRTRHTTSKATFKTQPGLKCSLTSTSFATDAVSAWCWCNNGQSRPVNKDLHIHENCPATSFAQDETMSALDNYKNTYTYTSTNKAHGVYEIQCEWGLPATLGDGSVTTNCVGSTTTVKTPATPRLTMLAPSGKGVFVGQMTSDALVYNVSSAIVAGCTNSSSISDAANIIGSQTMSPVIACNPTMTVTGVPYPPGGVGGNGIKIDGEFEIVSKQQMFFSSLDTVKAMANVTGSWLAKKISDNTTAMCSDVDPTYRTVTRRSVIPRMHRWLQARSPPGVDSSVDWKVNRFPNFESCYLPSELQVEWFSGQSNSHGVDERVNVNFQFKGIVPDPSKWDAGVCAASMGMQAGTMIGCALLPFLCPLLEIGDIALTLGCAIGSSSEGQR